MPGTDPPMTTPIVTILTGDIVASSRLGSGELDKVMVALAAASEQMWGWNTSAQHPAFERFRGDGWQMAIPKPALALRAAHFVRANLRSLGRARDSRISIGIGPGKIAPNAPLASASGPAFDLSGRNLDSMERSARFTIGWADPHPAESAWKAVFALADEISGRWTVRQAEVFLRMLPPGSGTQGAAADALGISQQMVAKHLAAGGDWALRQAIEAMETPE